MNLSEFLLARIADDEAVARRAGGAQWEEWGVDSGDAAHIARHDPVRVLAECEAKRAIVTAHPMMAARPSTLGHLLTGDGRKVSPYYRDGCCETCTAGGEYGGPADAGYRDSWRP